MAFTRAGNKKDNINIVYTPWSNLKKDGSMATGQVGFKDHRKVKRVLVDTRINAIINRLDKTRVETFPDLYAEKEERLKVVRAKEKKLALKRVGALCVMAVGGAWGADGIGWAQKEEEARIAKERRELSWQRDHAYDEVFTEDALEANSNEGRGADYFDDFM
jgi:hypothetical protein